MQWWLDKRADLEIQLALAAKSTRLQQINRLKNSIKRIDALLATMQR